MSEFKVGDRVRSRYYPAVWLVTRVVGEDSYELRHEGGTATMVTGAEYLLPITPTAPEEIEWGPWVELSEGDIFIAAGLYQAEWEHGRVIRYRLPRLKPAPVVTVTEQWLRFGALSGKLMDGDWSSPGAFRASVTRTTLDGKTTDVKIEVLK